MNISLMHKDMSDQEMYELIKKLNLDYPGRFISAKDWKKKRKERLKLKGLNWTK